jgi:hypothetical protein
VLAVDPEANRTCRIQVKSRWNTAARGFPMSRFDCDFVAFVRLNRGYSRPLTRGTGITSPQIYVLPIEVVRPAHIVSGWSKVMLSRIPDPDAYLDRWDLVRAFLHA